MKKIVVSLLIMVMMLSLTACSETKGEETNKEPKVEQVNNEKVLVYMSGPEGMIKKIEEGFEKENGDVLDITIMGCGQLRNKVWTESESGSIQADVFVGSDPILYEKLQAKEMLEELDITEIENIQDKYKLKDKKYALMNERYIVILANPEKIKEANYPKSFKDLKNEEFKNELTMADANQSATAFAIASSLYEMSGNNADYFKAIKENGLMLQKSNGLVPSSILDGQYNLGIAPHDAYIRLKSKGKKEGYNVPLELIWPEEGAIAVQRPIAISVQKDRTKEKEVLAEKFVNYMLSKKVQTITTNFGFVSVRKDIDNKYIKENEKVYTVDWEYASENEKTIKESYQEVFHE